MTALAPLPWLPDHSGAYVQSIAHGHGGCLGPAVLAELDRLVEENRQIHDRDCVNLNPATNVMSPRAEAVLSSGLGSRPSLGYPGDKYEMGLEAIEEIEVIAAELAAESSTQSMPRSGSPQARSPTSMASWPLRARRHDHRAAREHRR